MWYIIYQEKIKVKKPIQLTPTPDTLINLHPGNTDHLFLHKTLDLNQENTPLNNLLRQDSQEGNSFGPCQHLKSQLIQSQQQGASQLIK